MRSAHSVVRMLMLRYPELYFKKPEAYNNRDRLFLRVENVLGRRVSPETVTRSQRKVWREFIVVRGVA